MKDKFNYNRERGERMWFKITGRHMQLNAPEGRVLSFWLGAPSRKLALKQCKKLKIVDIESCEADSTFEQRIEVRYP